MQSWKQRVSTVGLLAVLVVAAVETARAAFTAGGHAAPQSTTPINLGNITGTYGGEGGVSNTGTSFPSSVQGNYGFHCAGDTCATKTQANGTQDNILKITATWHSGDPVNMVMTGFTELKDKTVSQLTTDKDCPPVDENGNPIGPPTFNINPSVTINAASDGTSGNSGVNVGTASYPFQHTSTQTSYSHSPSQPNPNGPPPGFGDQTQGTATSTTWTIDPLNPDTQTRSVSAKASVVFNNATAKEIVVGTALLKATAKLTANVTAAP